MLGEYCLRAHRNRALCWAPETLYTQTMGKPHAPSHHAVGDYDIWLLAQSWSAHFCCHHADKCHTVPWAFSANHLSLHGLWPGFSTPRSGGETFPENCATKAKLVQESMPRDYIDLAPSYTTWNATKHQAEVGGLAKHEWLKHGTCSGLSPDGYFAEALRAFSLLPGDRGTPELIKANVGGSVSAAALRASYAKRVAIKGDRGCNLSEVTACFSKLPDGRIDAQVDCPEHVMRGRDSPNCSTIRINQLGQCMLDAKKKR